jgi:exopolysaccharide biosynthesis polyprenyl glycosylphosphotransferase
MNVIDAGVVDQAWAAPRPTAHADDRRAERLVPFLGGLCLIVGDACMLAGAFAFAYWARFVAPDDGAAALGLEQYIRMGVMVSLISIILLAAQGLYDEEHPLGWLSRTYRIASAVCIALVVAISVSYLIGDQRFSRLWFADGWAFAIVALVIWRAVAHRAYSSVRDALVPANRVIIVGANALGIELAHELEERHHVVGYVDNGADLDVDGGLPLLGAIAQLEQVVQEYGADELIVALPVDRREQVERLIARGFHRRVRVKFVQDFVASALPRPRFEVQRLAGRPYLGFVTAARVSWTKRVMDVCLTTLGLVCIAPLFGIIALAVKLDSDGPVFYRQERVGKNGRTFWMLKFRSMRQDADKLLEELRERNEAIGPLFKMRDDPRITRVGKLLRRWSLDELPQLLNVLKGEMSLVGPRPPLPSEVAKYEDWEFGRLRTVPGITGLWQVSGRSEVPFKDMVRLDIHYIRTWSLGLDLEILMRTVPAVLTNRGAY